MHHKPIRAAWRPAKQIPESALNGFSGVAVEGCILLTCALLIPGECSHHISWCGAAAGVCDTGQHDRAAAAERQLVCGALPCSLLGLQCADVLARQIHAGRHRGLLGHQQGEERPLCQACLPPSLLCAHHLQVRQPGPCPILSRASDCCRFTTAALKRAPLSCWQMGFVELAVACVMWGCSLLTSSNPTSSWFSVRIWAALHCMTSV